MAVHRILKSDRIIGSVACIFALMVDLGLAAIVKANMSTALHTAAFIFLLLIATALLFVIIKINQMGVDLGDSEFTILHGLRQMTRYKVTDFSHYALTGSLGKPVIYVIRKDLKQAVPLPTKWGPLDDFSSVQAWASKHFSSLNKESGSADRYLTRKELVAEVMRLHEKF